MSKRYDLVIFDVDGTLHDSFLSIALSYQYALREGFGNDQPDLAVFAPCIGPPIQDSFAMFGVPPEDIDRAVELYQQFFRETGQHECRFYPGVERMLADFQAAGIEMAIGSSKLKEVLEYLLTRDGVRHYFGIVSGLLYPMEAASKKVLIERVLAHYGVTDKSRAVMVGDRFYDAEGAQQAGVDFIAAGYGMGREGEFDPYPMVFCADSVDALRQYILDEK